MRSTIHNWNQTMKFAVLIGRILFASPFLTFGLNHLTSGSQMNGMVPGFLPFPTLIVYLTGVLIIACGLMVAAGFKTKPAALILALFVFSTAILVHGGGFLAGELASTTNFMKDISIGGAGLLIWHFGAGPMSMDHSSSGARSQDDA